MFWIVCAIAAVFLFTKALAGGGEGEGSRQGPQGHGCAGRLAIIVVLFVLGAAMCASGRQADNSPSNSLHRPQSQEGCVRRDPCGRGR